MSKTQKASIDEMVKVVSQAEKPVTASEIVEACGLTRQTISNYRNELKNDQRIEQGEVGNATAYWASKTNRKNYPPSKNAKQIEINIGGESIEGWFTPKENTEKGNTGLLSLFKNWRG